MKILSIILQKFESLRSIILETLILNQLKMVQEKVTAEPETLPASFTISMHPEMSNDATQLNTAYVHSGDFITIRCVSDVDDIVDKLWVHNGKYARDVGLSVFNDRHSTWLRIESVGLPHFGVYQCLGSHISGHLEVSASLRLLNKSDKPKSKQFEKRHSNGPQKCDGLFATAFCQNGGTCFQTSAKTHFACLCPTTTYGAQCEKVFTSPQPLLMTQVQNGCSSKFVTAGLLAGFFAFALLVILVCLGMLVLSCRKKFFTLYANEYSSVSDISSFITGAYESFYSKNMYSPVPVVQDSTNLESGLISRVYYRSKSCDYEVFGRKSNQMRSLRLSIAQNLGEMNDKKLTTEAPDAEIALHQNPTRSPLRSSTSFNICVETSESNCNHFRRRNSNANFKGDVYSKKRPSEPNIKYGLFSIKDQSTYQFDEHFL